MNYNGLMFLYLFFCHSSFATTQYPITTTQDTIGVNRLNQKISIPDLVKVYPYYVNPEAYPDFSRRPFKTPTWKTFKDTVQFVGGRSWGNEFGVIDGKAPSWMEGVRVMRPNFTHFNMGKEELKIALLRLKKAGKYLFNINAYGPGSPVNGSFGEFKVEKWKVDMMKDILADGYMGYDLGEQDGRYWADSRSIDYPLSLDYKARYFKAMEYMRKAASDQGGVISMLAVKWFWHYPLKDGFVTISGAESQNKSFTSNDQIHYAFIRGASKQYGLLWYGDISVYNSWGWKSYHISDKGLDATKGNSISWMKRMLLSQYQYNAAILGFESEKFYSGKLNLILSPIGLLQQDMQNFVKVFPKPGPQHTPVAFMLDFFSGWMTPSLNLNKNDQYKIWNQLPYRKSDHLTHHLLNMYYNDYDKVGLTKDEYGGLTNTPYGDAVDVLLSDANVSTLNRYQLIVLGGEISTNINEVADRLLKYVENGGNLILTSENAQKVFPDLLQKTDDKSSLVYELRKGKGQIGIVNSEDWGIKKDNTLDSNLKKYLDRSFKATRIFSVGDSLGYITNINGKGNYILGIYNHSLKPRPFRINSLVGPILSIEELKPIGDLIKEPGYFPEGFENIDAGISDCENIAAGDARFFRVQLNEQRVQYLDKIAIEKRVENKYLSVSTLIGLPETLQKMPTFFDYFSGVKINWKTLVEEIDPLKLKEDCWWYNLKQLQFAIEFDSTFVTAIKQDKALFQNLLRNAFLISHVDVLLFTESFNAKMVQQISSKFKGKTMVCKFNSPKILIAEQGLIDFSNSVEKPIIVNRFYNSWAELYPLAKAMDAGTKFDIKAKVINPETIFEHSRIRSENAHFYFSHHLYATDLKELLQQQPAYLNHFGGVKVDGTYILSRSLKKCIEEAEYFKRQNLKVIVDLTREINGYPNITWFSENKTAYDFSVTVYQNILKKMGLMGIKDVIINTHMRAEQWPERISRKQEESMIDGMHKFIESANRLGIRVSIKNMRYKEYPSRLLATPKEVIGLVTGFKAHNKEVNFAADLSLGEDALEISNGKALTSMYVIAAEGSDFSDQKLPIYQLSTKLPADFSKNAVFVFDAEYMSFNELLIDKNFFTQQVLN